MSENDYIKARILHEQPVMMLPSCAGFLIQDAKAPAEPWEVWRWPMQRLDNRRILFQEVARRIGLDGANQRAAGRGNRRTMRKLVRIITQQNSWDKPR